MSDECIAKKNTLEKKKTKVLFMAVSKNTMSGGQTMLLNILKNINKDKYEATLLVQEECPLSLNAMNEGIYVHYEPFTKGIKFALNNRKLRKIVLPLLLILSSNSYLKGIKHENYDIIWCENFTLLLLASKYKFKKTRVVSNMWSTINSKFALKLISFIANYIIVEADFQRKNFESIGRVNNISTVYSQIDSKIFTNNYSKKTAKEKMGFTEDSFTIGFLGGCRYSKGFDYVVEVANELINKRKVQNIIFYVAGKTETDDLLLDAKVNDDINHLGDKLRIEDWISDKELFYKSLNLFISASRSEGLPGSLREAMGFEIPVIATDAGGSKEVVGDMEYIVHFSDKEKMTHQIADKIEGLLNNEQKYLSAIKYSKERVQELFVGTKWINTIESIFDELIIVNK
ncbi:hypothetical protein AOC36_01360 [Erysipelothrix larvae]|uniref:Glycosyl transferase family 1 domain-containing protein n=1 Tax=Erysipelothrix larvae TaxID=1514105 RepID=A0A0X8GYN7_9FIRM|nr:glycosyltransferase family 4 protein [Erysipelothrix larvae]AMC92684.1 hypothetical protein AOC36_01360 [Erysipelothrix larvae]